jgi:O-methyltransferase involved in polyketide biosynthesis
LILDLSQVSRTAILTLICRAVEAEKNPSLFNDPMAVLCLGRLASMSSGEDRRWILQKKRMYAGLHERDAKAGARRAQAFDNMTNRFIANNPKCTVVNLACGFDTRFWRIENEKCRYIELDLPGVVELKKEILEDQLGYEVIDKSVTDTSWIDRVTVNGNTGFLLLAEGLFPWIPPQDVARLLKGIEERFLRSQLVLDTVPQAWTRGLWKSLMRLHARIEWGLDVSWVFGIKNPHDLETYGNGLKVVGEEKGSAGPVITLSINAAGTAAAGAPGPHGVAGSG